MNPSTWLSTNLADVLIAVATAASALEQNGTRQTVLIQEGSQDAGTV
jgi:hypothetical protein